MHPYYLFSKALARRLLTPGACKRCVRITRLYMFSKYFQTPDVCTRCGITKDFHKMRQVFWQGIHLEYPALDAEVRHLQL